MATTTARRFHPGPWEQNKARSSDDPADLKLALGPGFVGAIVDLAWAQLEPRRGEYDWSVVERYLDWGAAHERQVAFVLYDRDFTTVLNKSKIVPRWLVDAGGATTFKRDNAGGVARIWEPQVSGWRIELIQALAARWDDHTNFEALALAETALGGINERTEPGYTDAAYLTEMLRTIDAGAAALRQAQLWCNLNYAPGDMLERLAARIALTGAGGITNPDSVPWENKPVYDIMRSWRGQITVALGGNPEQLDKPGGGHYRDMAQLVAMQQAFAVGDLGGNYVFWQGTFNSTVAGGGDLSKQYRAAIAAMVAAGHGATQTAVPTSLSIDTTPTEPTEPPAEPDVDLAALRAWLAEAEDLPAQIGAWLARGRELVG